MTISKEKSLISRTGALEFAKRFMAEGVTRDLSPVSFRMLSMLSGFAPPVIFATLGVSLQNSYRLRGAGYQVYSSVSPVKRSRRWLRHWLLMHSPSGICPWPTELWLTLPEQGCVDVYRLDRVRAFVLEQVSPGDFSEEEIDSLRLALDGDDEMFELFRNG